MNDPHVVSLRYKLKTDGTSYNHPPAIMVEMVAYRASLADDVLTVEMKEHHPTVENARQRVQDFLRAWEISVSLQQRRGDLAFEFENAEVIDRNPPPPGSVLFASSVNTLHPTDTATCTVTKTEYPAPPQGFAATPDVQTMWFRYQMYLDGKEPLLSMAYACLSLLEGTTGVKKGARKAVCKKYRIDQDVRDKLGDLTGERGSPEEARKLDADATRTPLTHQEKTWVETVVRTLIRRKAEYDFDSTTVFPNISLADFIKL